MQIEITTPAILFPATTLILLAYTAKLIQTGTLMRSLKNKAMKSKAPKLLLEIKNLRKRIYLIKNMQISGVGCLFFATLCMLMLFANLIKPAGICFSISLLMLLLSLFFCFREIQISTNALKVELGKENDGL